METGKGKQEAGSTVEPVALTYVQAKNKFDLHVLLIVEAGEKSLVKARAFAYAEGISGLNKRLAKALA